jgi:dermatan 4-sulfotransferase 1
MSGIGVMRPRISLRNRFVYFPISKAANSSIKWMLYNLEVHGKIRFGAHKTFRNQNQKMLVHDNFYGPLLTPWQIATNPEIDKSLAADGEFLKFTFVRNPFTRILSAYLDRAQHNNTGLYKMIQERKNKETFEFKEMLEAILEVPDPEREIHARSQASQTGARIFPDVQVGRFETLKQDFAALVARIYPKVDLDSELGDMDEVMVSPSKTGASEQIRTYFDAEAVEMVLTAFEMDFRELGYPQDIESLISTH